MDGLEAMVPLTSVRLCLVPYSRSVATQVLLSNVTDPDLYASYCVTAVMYSCLAWAVNNRLHKSSVYGLLSLQQMHVDMHASTLSLHICMA